MMFRSLLLLLVLASTSLAQESVDERIARLKAFVEAKEKPTPIVVKKQSAYNRAYWIAVEKKLPFVIFVNIGIEPLGYEASTVWLRTFNGSDTPRVLVSRPTGNGTVYTDEVTLPKEVSRQASPFEKQSAGPDDSNYADGSSDALDEVNGRRIARGLRPFQAAKYEALENKIADK